MTLSEQAAILLEALDQDFVKPDRIIRWADELLVAMPKPPMWLIDLSILAKPYKENVAGILRDQASSALTLQNQIQLVAHAWTRNVLPLHEAFRVLFQIVILDRSKHRPDILGKTAMDPLRGVLVEWDCQEDLDVIEPKTAAKMEALLKDYALPGSTMAQFLSPLMNPDTASTDASHPREN